MTITELQNRYRYHAPKAGQKEKYEAVREGCLVLAKLIKELTPHCREQSTAFTRLDEVMFHANAAIARNG